MNKFELVQALVEDACGLVAQESDVNAINWAAYDSNLRTARRLLNELMTDKDDKNVNNTRRAQVMVALRGND